MFGVIVLLKNLPPTKSHFASRDFAELIVPLVCVGSL